MEPEERLVYLASPYTGPPEIEEQRFIEASKASLFFLQQGVFHYSPIASCHPLRHFGKLPGDWHFWADFDRNFIDHCDEVWVLCIEGWDKSVGVTAEINYALSKEKTIKYVYKHGDVYSVLDRQT